MRKLTTNAFVAQSAPVAVSMETAAVVPANGNAYYWIDEDRIIDNPFQYRAIYETEKMLELAENVWLLKNDLPTLGLEQLPMGRLVYLVDGDYVPVPRNEIATHEQILYWLRRDDTRIELMFGHRRRRAWTILRHGMLDGCKRLGLSLSDEQRLRFVGLAGDPDYALMPMIIGYADDLQMWKHVVSENRHRSDTSAIEEAEAMQTAKSRFSLSDAKIGEIFGYARSTVANKMRLLELPEDVQQKMLTGEISERAGRTVLPLKDNPKQLAEALERSNGSIDTLEWNVKRHAERIAEEKAAANQADKLRERGWKVVESGEKFSNWGMVSTELITHKQCSKDFCPCFAACYDRNAVYNHRVDDAIAPDFVACCTDPDAAKEKYERLSRELRDARIDKEAVKKEKAKQVKSQVEQRWQEETAALRNAAGAKRLIARPEFWRVVVETLFHWAGKQAKAGEWKTMEEFETALMADMLYTLLEYKSGTETYDAKKVDKLIKRLEEAASP